MRIISGQFKNKKILQPTDKLTRPLKDITKESIFNIIEHSKFIKSNIKNSQILDLFSGSGSFGLECISRGAKNVFFCENYKPAVNIHKKNIHNFNCSEKTIILIEDVFKLLDSKIISKKKFEIIFLDPPFKEKKITKLLELIFEHNILEKNGIVILHRNKKDKDILPDKFNIKIDKTYGLSKIIFGCY